MKQLLTIILLCVGLSGFGQIKFRLNPNAINTSSTGTVINRGDAFYVYVQANGNGNSTTRQLLFDLQYDLTNFTLLGVTCTGTGGNGGVLPQNSSPTLSYYDYNGYTFNANSNNTGTNGTTNYQSSNYTYSANNTSSILRTTLTWSSTAVMPYGSYDNIIVFKFQLKAASTAYTFNPMKLNFVAAWNKSGQYDATVMEGPLSQAVIMNQNYGKYVTANVDLNSNLFNLAGLKLSFRDTVTKTGQLFNVTSTGAVDVNQSLLSPNTVYEVSLMHSMDKIYSIYNSAITISDFTTAQQEFTQNGLTPGGGQLGNILQTGQSFYAADLNRNQTIDGGDLPRLLGQVVGLDTLISLPPGYVAGSNGYMSLPTWKAAEAMTTGGQVEWAYIAPGASYSTLYIDMRQFSGVVPNTIKSIQLFDLYTGPIEYLTEDAYWAQYKVPSTFTKASDGTSNFQPYIRATNGNYNLRADFTFDVNPNHSWGSITTSNWNTITYPRTYFKTNVAGTNAILDLKYLLWGDVNRSHSSQVITTSNGTNTVQTNAVNSLQTNSTFKSMAISGTSFVNTPYDVSSIDVNLSNVTVTSNTVEIPVNVDTKGNKVGGLQFQFVYDPTKIKFEELANSVPNTWYTFVNAKDGIVKFGSLDQAGKTPITGTSIPFKLKFSTIGEGVNLLTSIKVSSTMDASSSNGTQLGINLNTISIKLTGYNNF
jgi:Cohesin domain